jgi:leucyl aminopeptidase
MKIQLCKDEPLRAKADLMVIGMFEEQKRLRGTAATVNTALKGVIQEVIREEKFKGDLGETLLIHTFGKISARRVCVMGLGKKKEFTLDHHRRAFARIVETAKKINAQNIVSTLLGWEEKKASEEEFSRSAAEGALLGDYSFEKYMKKEKKDGVSRISLLMEPGMVPSRIQTGIRRGTVSAEAANFARDLVNEPGNVITPVTLAAAARKIARDGGHTPKKQ